MKKVLLISLLIFGIGGSLSYAQPAYNSNPSGAALTQELSPSDMDAIFGGQVNVSPLSLDEMKSTQGFGFWNDFKRGFSWGTGFALALLLL
ncbi:hypothetical protein BKH41_06520 [Helicobacter sp. 12S02232-10]|uniref:hypothetical protein n=1 Tax=Helicobacter sp. 12S02232-10 TaxID=1476197 RepID=UPI000BA650D9|nr:hypothetical protein [Helicobacter sp. 12S02232-10]PAF47917.1 hypothetical protein BKH41_06520 [Helicobacter sp. 12S02232-10]